MGIDRLDKLKRMLKARTQGGEAMPQYRDSVPAIRAEIARLETPPKRVRKK